MTSSLPVNTSLDSRVLRIFSDVLGTESGPIELDSTPESIASWDSLQHLSVVLALEQEFSVQFAPEEIETLLTPGKVVEVIAAKLGDSKA
jgi:acyl carrier protein